jgi:hypothetical protein
MYFAVMYLLCSHPTPVLLQHYNRAVITGLCLNDALPPRVLAIYMYPLRHSKRSSGMFTN